MLLLFAPGSAMSTECVRRGGGISVTLFHHGERGLSLSPSLMDKNLLLGDSVGDKMSAAEDLENFQNYGNGIPVANRAGRCDIL